MNILRVFFFLCQERKVGHTRNKSQQDDRTSLGGVKKKNTLMEILHMGNGLNIIR